MRVQILARDIEFPTGWIGPKILRFSNTKLVRTSDILAKLHLLLQTTRVKLTSSLKTD
jgi:hypothetical protein